MDEYWKKLSKEIENLPEEARKAIDYWYEGSHGLFLILKDENGKEIVVFNAHCEMENWEYDFSRPDKRIDYEKDILEKMKEDKCDLTQEQRDGKLKTGLKDNFYVIPAGRLCGFAIFLSLPSQAAGILLQNTDTRETESGREASGQKHFPISSVARWVLAFQNYKHKEDLQSVVEDYLKAGKDDRQATLDKINEIVCEALGIEIGDRKDLSKVCEKVKGEIEIDLDDKKKFKILIDDCDGLGPAVINSHLIEAIRDICNKPGDLEKWKDILAKDPGNPIKASNDYLRKQIIRKRMDKNLDELEKKQGRKASE